MFRLTIEPGLAARCPTLHVALVAARVTNSAHDATLWEALEAMLGELGREPVESIKDHPAIAATRALYRACGKEPNRYRPAAEQLRRRAAQGKGLYRVNTLVDLVNLVSLRTGLSIGGFDASRIEGDLAWGIGRAGEPYEGIGRGPLNIEGLPVLRDRLGPFGSPTSDAERTKIRPDTTEFLLNISSAGGPGPAREAAALAEDLLRRHAAATDISQALIAAASAG